jgi:hypothetical protein
MEAKEKLKPVVDGLREGLRDRLVLFDPQGYLSRRLSLIRRLIERKGLIRERRGRDLIWRWREYPGPNWSLEWSDLNDKPQRG